MPRQKLYRNRVVYVMSLPLRKMKVTKDHMMKPLNSSISQVSLCTCPCRSTMLLAVPLLYTNKTAVVCFSSYIYLFLKEIRHMQQVTCRSVRGDSTLETRLVDLTGSLTWGSGGTCWLCVSYDCVMSCTSWWLCTCCLHWYRQQEQGEEEGCEFDKAMELCL